MCAFLQYSPVAAHRSFVHQTSLSKKPLRSRREALQPSRSTRHTRLHCTPKAVSTSNLVTQDDQLVDTLLFFLQGSDRGARMSSSDRMAVETIIEQLCNSTKDKQLTSDPSLFDDYSMVYCANGSKQKSPAAGGLLRTKLGRLLFPTKGLFENLVSPNIVVNLLCFRFLGLISSNIALRGKIVFSPSGPKKPNDLRFEFAQPRLRIGPAVFQLGPRPFIGTTLKYLDNRIRITVGKRGSRFIFVRRKRNEMPEADDWKAVYDAKPLPTILLPLALIAGIAAAWIAPPPIRAISLVLLAIIGFMFKTGGTSSFDPSNVPTNRAR